jgi:predicted phage terminase large subunit-like protein
MSYLEEAYSTKIRENVWGWWTESVLPRLNPLSNVVVMFHRWHSDDLAGLLLAEGGWESIRFPAIADGGADDPSGRQVGEPLSSRYPVTYLNELKKRQGSAAFNSLYQGRPVADGGNLLKRHWWRFWYPQGMPEPPALRVPMPDGSQFVCPQAPLPKEFHEALLSWDMAFKGADDSDFVVGQCWKRKDADKYLIDQVRAQLDFPATLQAVRAQVARFPEASTVLVEDKANGSAVLQVLAREISGLIPVQPQGGKEARVAAAAPAVESGNVYLPHPTLYPWVEGFIERSAAFPAGPNDDEQDAFSQALVRFRMTEFNLEKWQRPRDDDEAPSTADILEQFRRRKRGGE